MAFALVLRRNAKNVRERSYPGKDTACAVATALCAVRNGGPKNQTPHRGVATTVVWLLAITDEMKLRFDLFDKIMQTTSQLDRYRGLVWFGLFQIGELTSQ